MTTATRRLAFVSLLIVFLAIPAEVILLRALVTPSQNVAIQQWAQGLAPEALNRAATRIQSYPLQYRREIMRALPNEKRSEVWRTHLDAYLQTHPQLDDTAKGLVRTASDLLKPEIFAGPSDAERAVLHGVVEQLQATIGQEETEYLLYRLGPRDGTFASFEPIAMQLSNKVRNIFVASAQMWDCDCNMWAGCFSWSSSCTQAVLCKIDQEWPSCGWAWMDPCDGMCQAGW